MEAPEHPTAIARRSINLLLIAVMAIAVVGYFVGIDSGVPRHANEAPPRSAGTDAVGTRAAIPSSTYAEMRDRRDAARSRGTEDLARLRPEPRVIDDAYEPDPERKRASLALRSERRVHNGAPPVIPHAVEQLGRDACIACHEAGVQLADRTAKRLPHPYYSSCLQCHAPASPSIFDGSRTVSNGFDGVAAPFEGDRAWTGAPPVIPHTTWMRDNCLACHGPSGWPGMETTHPLRQNCLQCHAPSSVLDQAPRSLRAARFLAPPAIAGP